LKNPSQRGVDDPNVTTSSTYTHFGCLLPVLCGRQGITVGLGGLWTLRPLVGDPKCEALRRPVPARAGVAIAGSGAVQGRDPLLSVDEKATSLLVEVHQDLVSAGATAMDHNGQTTSGVAAPVDLLPDGPRGVHVGWSGGVGLVEPGLGGFEFVGLAVGVGGRVLPRWWGACGWSSVLRGHGSGVSDTPRSSALCVFTAGRSGPSKGREVGVWAAWRRTVPMSGSRS
jgi:hypothetical protein